MRGYDRYEYEDLDEYEEDFIDKEGEGAGEDEYEEEEEAPKPTKEVLDYLELRQRLKEQKRKELKKEIGAVNGSSREKKNLIARDSYGSFFGPSQPIIAPRVIQESKSLLESASLAKRVNKSNQSEKKSSGPSAPARKSQSSGQKPKVANGQHKKVEILKNTRDYSFLLSDDAELPVPKKVPPPRNISAPKPEVRSAQPPERNKGSVSSSGRKDFGSREDKGSVSNSGRKDFIREDKKSTTTVNRLQPKVGVERLSSGANQVRASIDSKKPIGAANGTLDDRRKKLSSSNGSGPGRPVMTKTAPSKVSVGMSEKKGNVPVSRNSAASVHRPPTSKSHPPVPRPSIARKEEYQVREKPKVIPKQSVPAPKPKQVIRPPAKSTARDPSRDERPRKRPIRHDDDDDDPDNAISMIRSMFGYNPRRYEDVDDDSDMEANFDDIMREERRSAKIAQQEDEEEFRKIEEEERRERMRKEAKRRKLSNR